MANGASHQLVLGDADSLVLYRELPGLGRLGQHRPLTVLAVTSLATGEGMLELLVTIDPARIVDRMHPVRAIQRQGKRAGRVTRIALNNGTGMSLQLNGRLVVIGNDTPR